jgi:hypothetical protein
MKKPAASTITKTKKNKGLKNFGNRGANHSASNAGNNYLEHYVEQRLFD